MGCVNTRALVFWRTIVQDSSLGRCLYWAATEQESLRNARDAISLGKICDDDAPPELLGKPERFELEPTIDALVRWLDLYFKTDNG